MSEENAPIKRKRQRIRINRETGNPISSAPTSPSAAKSFESRSITRKIFTRPDARKEFSQRNYLDEKDLLRELLTNLDLCCLKHRARVTSYLQKIVNKNDVKALQNGNFAELVRKYHAALRRQYVCLMAKEDVRNYASATPESLLRDDDVRLETMEQLLRLVERREIPEAQFNFIHKKYFADIIAKDSLPDANVTKILRCMAAGKFYAPVDKNHQLNERLLSEAFRSWQKTKKVKQYAPEDYDFFGQNDKGEPLSTLWNAVNGSSNFHKMAKVFAQKFSEMGIAPEKAYQFNSYDLAYILQRDPKNLEDVAFVDVVPDVCDSPYQELASKMGDILMLGGAENLTEREKQKIWLERFASKSEIEDWNDSGSKVDYQLCMRKVSTIYNKLQQDFVENGMDPDFLCQWAHSLKENKSFNPKLVSGCSSIPYKIDIHHWDRLSAASGDEIAADKNLLENFGIMIMYNKDGVDIHAEEHKGESANFVLDSFRDRQERHPTKYLLKTSNFLSLSSDLVKGMGDRFKPLAKIKKLQEKLAPQKKKSTREVPYSGRSYSRV